MYRIEVAPGEETVFRTIEELAVGIRNGVVTPRSRIYHNASQKWLPIGLHPHYKKAMELPTASATYPGTVETRTRGEHRASAPNAAAPKILAPVTSPVVAMQQEVLRDLPVVAIPEPLPWSALPAPASPARPAVPAAPIAVPVLVTYASPPARAEPAALPAHRQPREATHARPTARRSPRAGGRPLLLLGVATALVVAAHLALSATPSSSVDASDLPAEEPADPAAPPKTVAAAEPAARVGLAPAPVPMTPGPAFAGSAPARPGETIGPRRPTAPAAAAAPSPATTDPAAPSIAPAPVELELAMPDLPADSIVPSRRTGDTMAMKKILRALNGTNSSEPPAAP